jgi:hypothetical protein
MHIAMNNIYISTCLYRYTGAILMEVEERHKKIMGYVQANPGCNKEMVVKNFCEQISRVTILNDLVDLKNQGIISITNKKQNSRDHHLFVNADNILVSVSNELKEFEKSMFYLLEKSKIVFDNEFKTGKSNSELYALTKYPIVIFYDMINMYIFRDLLKWSVNIQDKEIFRKLNSMVFTRIAEMQLRMNETLGSTLVGTFNQMRQDFFITSKLYATDKLKDYTEFYTKVGMKKEIKQLIDSLWNINLDLQEIAYPEALEYGWDFRYRMDNWLKFLELQKQNPGQTHDRYMEEGVKKVKAQLKTPRRTKTNTKNI